MFFSGDTSTRKRADLGGQSTKERDRKKLLEETRLEQNCRLWLRQQNSAALQIQKFFRGRIAVGAEHCRVREHFLYAYGRQCQYVDRFTKDGILAEGLFWKDVEGLMEILGVKMQILEVQMMLDNHLRQA